MINGVNMTAKTAKASASTQRNDIMTRMADKPMSVVVEYMAKNIIMPTDGKPMGAARAKAYYVDGVKSKGLPGKVENLVVVKTPKAAKPKATAPKTPKAAKTPADRKDALRAAAKRAGVHRESVAEALQGTDDPLNLAAPETLTFDDLKEIL